MRRILCFVMTMALCLGLVAPAAAEWTLVPEMELWDTTTPVEITLSADVKTHMPFDDDRLAQLTALLKHMSLRLNWQQLGDEAWSRIGVMLDGQEVMSMAQRETEHATEVQLSAMPDSVYTFPAEEVSALSSLLGQEGGAVTLYGLDGTEQAWIDDAYEMFYYIGADLESYKKESSVKTAIKNMGTARIKQVYTIPKDEASVIGQAMASHCPEGELFSLISSLVFSGKQVLTMWLDKDENLLRVEYKGKCGMDEDHLRNVNLTWRMRRDSENVRDYISLKTPAVKGTDRNSVTYERAMLKKSNDTITYDSEFKYEWVLNKQKTTLTGEVDVTSKPSGSGTKLTGTAMVKQLLPGEDTSTRVEITPDLLIGSAEGNETAPEITGTVTVEEYRGKNVIEKADIHVKVTASEHFDWVLRENAVDAASLGADEAAALAQQVSMAVAGELIPHLVLLPQEDTMFLSADLPEDVWQNIVDAAQAALQKEDTP